MFLYLHVEFKKRNTYLLFVTKKGIVNGMTAQEVDAHLEMGKQLLATGQLADALTQFHSAIGNTLTNCIIKRHLRVELF